MPVCFVLGCNNRSGSKTKIQKTKELVKKITFHQLPKEVDRRKAWLAAVRRVGRNPTRATVCSEHFTEDQIDRTSLSCVRLRETAVPTIFYKPIHRVRKTKNSRLGRNTTSSISNCQKNNVAEIDAIPATSESISQTISFTSLCNGGQLSTEIDDVPFAASESSQHNLIVSSATLPSGVKISISQSALPQNQIIVPDIISSDNNNALARHNLIVSSPTVPSGFKETIPQANEMVLIITSQQVKQTAETLPISSELSSHNKSIVSSPALPSVLRRTLLLPITPQREQRIQDTPANPTSESDDIDAVHSPSNDLSEKTFENNERIETPTEKILRATLKEVRSQHRRKVKRLQQLNRRYANKIESLKTMLATLKGKSDTDKEHISIKTRKTKDANLKEHEETIWYEVIPLS